MREYVYQHPASVALLLCAHVYNHILPKRLAKRIPALSHPVPSTFNQLFPTHWDILRTRPIACISRISSRAPTLDPSSAQYGGQHFNLHLPPFSFPNPPRSTKSLAALRSHLPKLAGLDDNLRYLRHRSGLSQSTPAHRGISLHGVWIPSRRQLPRRRLT